MDKLMLVSVAAAVLLAGCGDTASPKALQSHTEHHRVRRTCTVRVAMSMVRRSELGSSTPPSGYRLVGGGPSDGWLFSHTEGFDVYVGPNCDPWFPITVGAIVQKVQSVQYADHRFTLVGVGNGSDSSNAPAVPPYRLVVDPATGLETIHYSMLPIDDGVEIVNPLFPNAPPVNIHSLSVVSTSTGFRIVLSTDLPKRATFSLVGGMLYNSDGSPTSTYQLIIQGGRLSRVYVPSSLPLAVTVSKGLPSIYTTSIYSPSDWRSLPKSVSTTLKAGDNAYTVNLVGVSPEWTVTTTETRGVITVTITK